MPIDGEVDSSQSFLNLVSTERMLVDCLDSNEMRILKCGPKEPAVFVSYRLIIHFPVPVRCLLYIGIHDTVDLSSFLLTSPNPIVFQYFLFFGCRKRTETWDNICVS